MGAVKHAHQTAIADDPSSDVSSSEWNEDHTVTLSAADVGADAAGAAATLVAAHEIDTTSVHGITDTSALYRAGGTDVAVADGGTGASSAATARTNLGLGALATKATVATADIDNDAVTYAKIQNVSATSRILGRKTAGAGDVEELTGAEAAAIIGSTGSGGLVATPVKTANYTAAAGEFVPVDTSGGGVNVTLPSAPADGTIVGAKVVAIGGTLSIVRGGTDVFNLSGGATSLALNRLNQSVYLVYRASGGIWYVASGDVGNISAIKLGNLYVPAGAMLPSITSGAVGPTQIETATNKQNLVVLDFPDAVTSYASFSVDMPTDWDGSTVTAEFEWTNANTTANSVRWQIEGRAYSDGDNIDQAWGTAQAVTDAYGASVNNFRRTSATPALTLAATVAGGQRAIFRVARLGADAADTLASDARLLGVRVVYGRV